MGRSPRFLKKSQTLLLPNPNFSLYYSLLPPPFPCALLEKAEKI